MLTLGFQMLGLLGFSRLTHSVSFYLLPFFRCERVCEKSLRERSHLQKFDWRISLQLLPGMGRTELPAQSVSPSHPSSVFFRCKAKRPPLPPPLASSHSRWLANIAIVLASLTFFLTCGNPFFFLLFFLTHLG